MPDPQAAGRDRRPQPPTDAAAVSARLRELIAGEIAAAGGWIGFDRYMELALYAPGLGYYAAGSHKLGDAASGGDFITAPEISPLFARTLAAQVAQVFAETAPRIVEFGAGSGVLARDLIAALSARGTPVAQYSIVELAADLRERQQHLLAGRPVQWISTPPHDFVGVLLANEVLDVMPVQLFVKRAAGVLERGVTTHGDVLALADRPAQSALGEEVARIEQNVGALPEHYVSEVGFIASAWLRSCADWLRHGALLAIDYGFPQHEYYHPQRLMGTLMCHYRHQAHAEPLWLPGLNDITAHVDFSAAATAAHDAGLDVLGYTSQAHFLLNCGLLREVENDITIEPVAAANAIRRLTSESEMGELFKALAVGRGIDVPLIGFAHGDRRHTL